MLTTTETAALAGTSRYTVEREIRRGRLAAGRLGRHYAIEPDEAKRWAAQFRPYEGLRKDRSRSAS